MARRWCLLLAATALLAAGPAWPDARERAFQLPLRFEPNHGQSGRDVLFQARGPGHALALGRRSATIEFGTRAQWAAVRMEWRHGNPNARVSGRDPLPGRSHYFRGKDERRWVRGVEQYGTVAYERVYPGIDLTFYGSAREFEFDFVVAPGADPGRIELEWTGADRVALGTDGDLEFTAGEQRFRTRKPVAYQVIGGERVMVAARYRLVGTVVRFEVGPYDRRAALTIDPVVSVSTHTGWGEAEYPAGIAVDAEGNAYVTGWTYSQPNPGLGGPILGVTTGDVYAVVLKINSAGTEVMFATFLGGTSSGGYGIAVDRSGAVVFTGVAPSTDFPTTPGAFQTKGGGGIDAFVAKLSPAGDNLIYCTYLGGSGSEYAVALALDPDGNPTITGYTYSTNLPVRGAVQSTLKVGPDIFVARLNASGAALLFSTYWGGSSADTPAGIAVDGEGATYVTGSTYSTDFPKVRALQGELRGTRDMFVLKLSPAADAVRYSTYLGGSLDDGANAILADEWGQAYVAGFARSPDFPVTEGAFQTTHSGYLDGVLCKLSIWGETLMASTFYGGRFRENLFGLARDPIGNIVATGFTTSPDLPLREAVREAPQGAAGALSISEDDGARWSSYGTLVADTIAMLTADPNEPNTLYAGVAGNVGGVVKSTDGGANWSAGEWPEGLTSGMVAIDRTDGNRVYAATSSGVLVSDDAGASWKRTPLVSSSVAIAIHPSNPAILFAGSGTRLYRSMDRGATWTALTSGLPALTINSIAISPANPNQMVVATASYLYRTLDGGATWSMTGSFFPLITGAIHLALDPSNPRTIYAATPSSGVYRSTDAGMNWSKVLDLNRRVNQVAVHPTDGKVIFAVVPGEGVMRTTDGGGTWTSVRSDQMVNPNWIWIDPRNPGRMLAGGAMHTDITVAKFHPDLNALLFSTSWGGVANEIGRAVAVDAAGNVFVTGETGGWDFPVTPNAVPPESSRFVTSGFLLKLSSVPQ